MDKVTLPNILSVIRMLCAPVFLYLFRSNDIILQRLSFAVFIFAVLTDWYDGWHARKYKSVTNLGIFIDPLADKVLTTSVFYLFYLLGFMPLWMLIIIIIRDIFVTLLRSYDEYRGKVLKTSFVAKSKTFLQMTYLFFVLTLFLLLTYDINMNYKNIISDFIFHSNINYILLLFITLITLYTGIDYILSKQKISKDKV